MMNWIKLIAKNNPSAPSSFTYVSGNGNPYRFFQIKYFKDQTEKIAAAAEMSK